MFDNKLRDCSKTCQMIMENPSEDINSSYSRWKRLIEKKAMECIGKTTIKSSKPHDESITMTRLRKEKKNAKHAFQMEKDPVIKCHLKRKYIEKQVEVRQQIQHEQEERIEMKISKMAEQGARGFWREMKN